MKNATESLRCCLQIGYLVLPTVTNSKIYHPSRNAKENNKSCNVVCDMCMWHLVLCRKIKGEKTTTRDYGKKKKRRRMNEKPA